MLRWLSAVLWIESLGHFALIRSPCYRLNVAGYMVSLIGWLRAKMVRGVKCDNCKWLVFVSPPVAGNLATRWWDICFRYVWRKWCSIKKWTCLKIRWLVLYKLDNYWCCEFLFDWTTAVLTYSLYTRANAVDLWSHESINCFKLIVLAYMAANFGYKTLLQYWCFVCCLAKNVS